MGLEQHDPRRDAKIKAPLGVTLVKEKVLSPKDLEKGLDNLINVLPPDLQKVAREVLAKTQS